MTVNFSPGDLVRARGREWVALPSPQGGILALRPLSGSENDTVILDPELEILPVEPARFDLPAGKLPQSCQILALRPLGQQHPAVRIYQRARSNQQYLFIAHRNQYPGF